MSWIFRPNIANPTIAVQYFELKELLVEAGWEVTQSGNGTTYNPTGDVIQSSADLNVSRAWFSIRSPEVGGKRRSFTFQRGGNTNSAEARVKYSKEKGFVGGSPDAVTTPYAEDEGIIAGGGTDEAPTWSNLQGYQSEVSTGIAHAGAEAGGCSFYLAAYRTNRQQSMTGICLDYLADGSYPDSDEDPVVVYVARLTSAGNLTNAWSVGSNLGLASTSFSPYSWLGPEFVAVNACYYGYGSFSSSGYGSFNGFSTNPVTGEDVLLPLVYARSSLQSAPRGVKGISGIMRLNSNIRQSGDTTADLKYIQMGHVVLPWDGQTVPQG